MRTSPWWNTYRTRRQFEPSQEDAGPVDSLLDLHFGAASDTVLWSIERLRSWRKPARLKTGSSCESAPCALLQNASRQETDETLAPCICVKVVGRMSSFLQS